MPSEREIDNYIDNMEEENVIYVDKELEYAEKCHKLEEKLGCPLEVVIKAINKGIFAEDLPSGKIVKWFGLSLSRVKTEWYLSNEKICVGLKDYKKIWWLKETREE